MKVPVTLFMLFLLVSIQLPAQSCPLEFNGFYYHKIDGETSAVIRFFENGEVLVTTSTSSYEDLLKYLSVERKDMMLHGKYKWKKCSASFTVKGDTGEEHLDIKKEGDDL